MAYRFSATGGEGGGRSGLPRGKVPSSDLVPIDKLPTSGTA